MSFYTEMCSAVRDKSNQQSDPEAMGRAIDQVFEEFCKTTIWPADKIKFSELDTPAHFEQKPSKVLQLTDQGRMGVMVHLECESEKHSLPCTLSWSGGNKFRLFFEQGNKSFSSIRSQEVKATVELIQHKILHRITGERSPDSE